MALYQPPNFLVIFNPQIFFLPFGSWGISYDISTNNTEFDAPDGWYAWRSATYSALKRRLMVMGFHRHQYSDFRSDNIMGIHAFLTALLLKFINPPMKLETTVLGLKIHYYSNLHLLDLTDSVQIGGVFSRNLRGPIPESLLPAGAVVVGMNGGPPVHPLPNFHLPKYTQPSQNTLDPNNWLT